ncbi:MAG: EamA family transporter [Burkholderiales bacterium]|nr:EamA family transporter [Burkholderiales bacterium]
MNTLSAPSWLWIVCTIGACAAQTLRNAMQRSLVERVGTVGATHVRFLFGLPFALLFLAVVASVSDFSGVRLSAAFAGWVLVGAATQILATALMLAAMRERSFVVTIAYTKTEPVQVALFGAVFLGEYVGPLAMVAIVVATTGVWLMSVPAGGAQAFGRGSLRPALLGIASGACFALSAVGFRAAILALGDGGFVPRATLTLAIGLVLQTLALSAWLLWRDRRALAEIMRAWRPSVLAGMMGALASQMWFLAFALQSAAAVRTLGLVEILFAQIVSRRLLSQSSTRREGGGLLLVIIGVLVLLSA